MRYFKLTIMTCCALLAACSSTPKISAVSDAPVSQSAGPAPEPAKTAAVTETEVQRQERLMKALKEKSVYFDYDDFSIKSQYHDPIKQDAEFLKSSPRVTVTLQGNADERGSSEYNLALGQKRAEAVKRELKLLGVPEDRMEAISFGKEKPRADCHEEKCWAENRRADFVFASKP